MTDYATPRTSPVKVGGFGTRSGVGRRLMERDSPIRRIDWVLQGAVLGLCVIGCLLVWSATKHHSIDPNAFLKKDVLNVGLGMSLCALAMRIDYRTVRAYAPLVFGASVLGLLVVLSPLGSTINGAHSWIILPAGFQIQPSEFAKVALIVGAGMILGEKRDDSAQPTDRDVILLLGLAAIPMILIMGQPDFGTMMVFVFTILGVLTVSGAPKRWTLGLIAAGVAFGFAILHFHLLKAYQEARLTSFVNPSAHLANNGYNTNQARIAIGSGGFSGAGLFHGAQTSGQFVPEQQTDFVFTVAGEELGFVGAGLIIVLLGVVLWRALRIANAAADAFGTLVCAGVVSWFAFQSFINIGMTMGIMPVTGLPLPFVSYGGSAMFANLIAIGLIQNVHLRTRRA